MTERDRERSGRPVGRPAGRPAGQQLHSYIVMGNLKVAIRIFGALVGWASSVSGMSLYAPLIVHAEFIFDILFGQFDVWDDHLGKRDILYRRGVAPRRLPHTA